MQPCGDLCQVCSPLWHSSRGTGGRGTGGSAFRAAGRLRLETAGAAAVSGQGSADLSAGWRGWQAAFPGQTARLTRPVGSAMG